MIERLLPHGFATPQTPNRIVVHCMAEFVDYEGERLHAVDLLDRLGLSAHVLIPPQGEPIRCRDDFQGAWHAADFNTNSLGVEVLVPEVYNLDQLMKRTSSPWVGVEQMNKLVEVVMTWKRLHPIQRIDRHSDLSPKRKWYDPGRGFPWEELLSRTWSCVQV